MIEIPFARIETDKYIPKNRPFNEATDYRYRVVYENLTTGGLKKENYRSIEQAQTRKDELNELHKQNRKNEISFINATVNDAVDRFINDGACKEYAYNYLRLIRHYIGSVRLSELEEMHIRQFKNRLDNGKRVPRSINAYLVCLRTILNHCQKKRLISSFPHIAFFIDNDKEVIRDRVLTPQEFLRLLLACRKKTVCGKRRLYLIPYLIWLHETGMRKGELAQVQIKDIDLSNSIVRVWSGKSKVRKQRECGITPRLEKLILKTGVLERPQDTLLFPNKSYRSAFETARRLARLEDFRLHDLRRTAITRFLERGLSVELVGKLVGHSSSSMTLTVYTKFRSDYIREQMAKMA